ncbi:MAG: type II secretion system protein [Bacilli bacterium]|nr:type II secretion system protein [Bacilli bacterium]
MKKNKKGFTLIELLVTISLIAVLATITTISVNGILNKSKSNASKIEESVVKSAGNEYIIDNYNECKNGCVIPIDELKDYIENFDNVRDKFVCVKVEVTGNKKTVNTSKSLSDCGIKENYPKLADGMIPVIYNDTNDVWEVADISSKWYDYENQWWANAVTVSDATYRTAEAGTPIPMDSINTMWVWIPRFKYRIPNNIGSSSNVTEPPQIDVVFESGVQTTGISEKEYRNGITSSGTNANYYTHPAFRNISNIEYDESTTSRGAWDTEITGFWVGKFETSIDESVTTDNSNTCYSKKDSTNCNNSNLTPIIKPDVASLNYQNISNQFLTSLKFANGTMDTTTGEVTFIKNPNNIYGLNSKEATTDTHMMKNTEWGAVAILSQSQYGKSGNTSYTIPNKEIYNNNSYNSTNNETYTGRSSGGPSENSTTYGTYSYNDKICTTTSPICIGEESKYAGTGASTTGTIYGIYDMSGGLNEHTMGVWDNDKKSSGFSILPESKYYDLYRGTSSKSISKEKSIMGDATYETKKWYSDVDYFVYTNSPWINRGGYYSQNSIVGIINSNSSSGKELMNYSFRVTLIP